MEDFKVSAVQMNALKDDLDHNLDVHVRFTEEAANAGSAMVLFPELSVTAHYGDPEAVKFAQEAESGRTYSLMCDLARKHDIVIGY
jgi:predicted amidohydrolase